MIPVTKTFLPDFEDYANLLKGTWHSAILTNNGPLEKNLATALMATLDVPNIQLVANGTLALQLAIKALDLQGEIITTPYSYVATTNAILWENCTPVFVDVNEKNFCLEPDLIEAAITEKTSAILATHVYGYPCDVERIQQIADHHNLKIIYDAAHAFGVRINGQSVLRYGDCSTISFHATKLFNTAEGGAVISANSAISKKIFLMGKFGHIGEDDYLELGINAKLSELHAAMGLAVLPLVNHNISARKQCSEWYDEFFEGADLQRLQLNDNFEYNYAYYPVIFKSHMAMMKSRAALNTLNIFPRRYFSPSLNTLPFLSPTLRRLCPVSESLAQRVLSLPLYDGLQRDDIETIATCIIQVIQ